jgi:hypothetical protein
VLASPSWYRSMRGLGIGRRNGGCDLVVGIGVFVGGAVVGLSPICGIYVVSAQWSLWLVFMVVMVVSACVRSGVGGRRMSQ